MLDFCLNIYVCGYNERCDMPIVFKNPLLPDYFVGAANVRRDASLEEVVPVVDLYEAGKVIYFPELRLDINHDFWAALSTDEYPELKKLKSDPGIDPSKDDVLAKGVAKSGLPKAVAAGLRQQITQLTEQIFPIYERLFAGYEFVHRRAVWRLNTTLNENLHLDTYHDVSLDHFARMFINLDNQPRIWHTSWRADELFERFAPEVPPDVLTKGSADQFRTAINKAAFGGATAIWWDGQPRHVIYFQPGDVWVVDSRQVSHQIFYGRRAVSIDFRVTPGSMLDPKRQYLAMADSALAKINQQSFQPRAEAAGVAS